MDIIVKGIGNKDYRPNQVKLSFNFETIEKKYDETLEKGTKNVLDYCNLLYDFGFKKEDIKTRSFRVREHSVYNNDKKIYESDGYVYNQSASVSFDYDMDKLSKLMELTSKCKFAPTYNIYFNIKDRKKVENEILALAYKDAKEQAEIIAKASGKEIKDCIKISFQPFDNSLTSESSYQDFRYEEAKFAKAKESASANITKVFVPEDVSVSTTIYCLFVTK